MHEQYPLDTKRLKEYNRIKYKGVAPSWELIQKVIKASGLKCQSHFEMVWGIARKILTQVKNGDKSLPLRYWHIFYDFKKMRRAANQKPVAEKEKANVEILSKNKDIIDALKLSQSAG